MKNLIKILPIALFIACGPSPEKSGEVKELIERRDSLQTAQLDIQKEINNLNAQIATHDNSTPEEQFTLIKKIAQQRNKIVGMNRNLKALENQLASMKKEKSLVPVAIKEMKPEPFSDYIIVYGNVESDNYALISPEMGGRVEKIHVKEGDWVKRGQLLVSLNTAAVDKQIKGVKSGLELAETTYEKQNILWEQGIGSEIQYLNAKNAMETLEAQLETLQAQLRMAQIRAPFDGMVDKIFPKKGEMAGSQFPVVEFVSLGKMTIKADVSEKYIGKVKAGQQVELTFSSLPEFKEGVRITRVSKVINSASRTFEVELHVNNKKELIKPNMVSTIKINVFTEDKAFVVPSLAIRKDITGSYVYVANGKDGQNLVEKRPVKTAFSYEDNTMVSGGLTENDKVIVKGYHLVNAGMQVDIVE